MKGVVVPEISDPFSNSQLQEWKKLVNPAANSDCFGMDIYIKALRLMQDMIT